MKSANSRSSPHGGVASSTEWPSSREQRGGVLGGGGALRVRPARRSAATSSARPAADPGRGRPPRRTAARAAAPTTGRRSRSRPSTSSSAAASSTVRVSGPLVEKPSSPPYGAGETRPRAGLIPNRPQHEAGIRIEPPPSLPVRGGREPGRDRRRGAAARPARRAATCPTGCGTAPFSSDSVTAVIPSSGVFVLPITTKPGVLEPAHDGGVEVGHVVGERARGERRPDPGRLVQVLDRQRHAAERAVGQLAGSSRERLVRADGDEGVQLRVEPLDPLRGRARRARPA